MALYPLNSRPGFQPLKSPRLKLAELLMTQGLGRVKLSRELHGLKREGVVRWRWVPCLGRDMAALQFSKLASFSWKHAWLKGGLRQDMLVISAPGSLCWAESFNDRKRVELLPLPEVRALVLGAASSRYTTRHGGVLAGLLSEMIRTDEKRETQRVAAYLCPKAELLMVTRNPEEESAVGELNADEGRLCQPVTTGAAPQDLLHRTLELTGPQLGSGGKSRTLVQLPELVQARASGQFTDTGTWYLNPWRCVQGNDAVASELLPGDKWRLHVRRGFEERVDGVYRLKLKYEAAPLVKDVDGRTLSDLRLKVDVTWEHDALPGVSEAELLEGRLSRSGWRLIRVSSDKVKSSERVLLNSLGAGEAAFSWQQWGLPVSPLIVDPGDWSALCILNWLLGGVRLKHVSSSRRGLTDDTLREVRFDVWSGQHLNVRTRARLGLTLARVAEKYNLSIAAVSNYTSESGRTGRASWVQHRTEFTKHWGDVRDAFVSEEDVDADAAQKGEEQWAHALAKLETEMATGQAEMLRLKRELELQRRRADIAEAEARRLRTKQPVKQPIKQPTRLRLTDETQETQEVDETEVADEVTGEWELPPPPSFDEPFITPYRGTTEE